MIKNQDRKVALYKITFPNGKIYFGQTVEFQTRMNNHHALSRRGEIKPLYNAIRKYGWDNISKEIVLTTTDDKIDQEEIAHIEKYATLVGDKGYNLTPGGRKGNMMYLPVTKEKQRETRKKNRFKTSTNGKQRILQYTKEGLFVQEHFSVARAAKSLKTSDAHIHECVYHPEIAKTAMGFQWRPVNGTRPKKISTPIKIRQNAKEVKVQDKITKELIGIYHSAYNACKELGINYSASVKQHLTRKPGRVSTHGYIMTYT